MRAALVFSIGAVLGYSIGFRGLPHLCVLLMCAIPISIACFKQVKKEEEQEKLELGKHSYYWPNK